MDKMRAVVVEPDSADRLVIREVDLPEPKQSEVLVRVAAFSLNRGEVRGALTATEAGGRPGWDVAGTVDRAAVDGSGPGVGSRVVGFVASGAWAEFVVVPVNALAVLPENVSFAEAATLPVAGLTALHALERGSGLLARNLLVTGASGGVGLFACALGQLMGARVTGVIRHAEFEPIVKAAGADNIVVSDDGGAARPFGPYRLVVESVGGQSLANAMSMLAPDGVCVSFGASGGFEVTFNLWSLVSPGRASLYGLGLFNEVAREPAAVGLERLVTLLAKGLLRPHISLRRDWGEAGRTARELLDRRFAGKAVLEVN